MEEEEEDENNMSDEDDIYFIDELGNVVFPVEDDIELEEECFSRMAIADDRSGITGRSNWILHRKWKYSTG